MSLWKYANAARQAARLESATRNPGRYVRNRAKSKALGSVGFWRAWRKLWRM